MTAGVEASCKKIQVLIDMLPQEDAMKKCEASTNLVGSCREPQQCVRKLDPVGPGVEYRLGYKRKYVCAAACER